MTVRTTETTVTFRHPFMMDEFETPQPAGTYRLVIEEETMEGLTFLAFKRKATMLHIPVAPGSSSPGEIYIVTAAELAAALEADTRD